MCERQEAAYHQGWVMEKRNESGKWCTAGPGASVKDGISLQEWMKARTGTQGPALQESPHFKKENKSEMRKNGQGGMRAGKWSGSL